jgi:hypothetical protein
MKSTCQRIQAAMPAAVERELDEGAREKILAHARRCPACDELLRFQTDLWEAGKRAPLRSAPPVYFEGVLEEIHRRMPLAPRSVPLQLRWRLRPQTMATAAVAALAVIWLGAAAGPLTPGGLGGFWRDAGPASARSTTIVAAQAVPAPVPTPMIAIENIGLVRADSPILQMSASMRREIGLPEENVRASIFSHLQRG